MTADLKTAQPKTLLVFAERASKCPSPEAAVLVFRVVPTLLLRSLDPAEIERAYAFLQRDREQSFRLFKVLLTDDNPIISPGLERLPRELSQVRPERALGLTWKELDTLTPKLERTIAPA